MSEHLHVAVSLSSIGIARVWLAWLRRRMSLRSGGSQDSDLMVDGDLSSHAQDPQDGSQPPRCVGIPPRPGVLDTGRPGRTLWAHPSTPRRSDRVDMVVVS